MQDLRVIGVENGALLVSSEDGERYRIPIDEVLQSKLRQSAPEPGAGRKLAPREIQAHIRAGMSAEDVSSVTGVPLEYIQRFEGPVLAEREFVIETALGVPVHTSADIDPLAAATNFGTVIRERLVDLGAINERWASWKEQGAGWVVKLAFTANQIDHDARWRFDPKKLALSPMNSEATTLSQQGEVSGGLIPRLRAVAPGERTADATRFDSGAFLIDDDNQFVAVTDTGPVANRTLPIPDAARSATAPAPENSQTADLLEALRRRRGEREAANFDDDDVAAVVPGGGIRLVDIPLDDFDDIDERDSAAAESAVADDAQHAATNGFAPQPKSAAKKGRASMPSWDEIVFGARSDDDPT
jgi:Protein of unknown function (DUF3071)